MQLDGLTEAGGRTPVTSRPTAPFQSPHLRKHNSVVASIFLHSALSLRPTARPGPGKATSQGVLSEG